MTVHTDYDTDQNSLDLAVAHDQKLGQQNNLMNYFCTERCHQEKLYNKLLRNRHIIMKQQIRGSAGSSMQPEGIGIPVKTREIAKQYCKNHPQCKKSIIKPLYNEPS